MINNIETFLSLVPVGIVLVDKNREIVGMNPYARDIILSKEYYNKDVLELHKSQNGQGKITEFFSKLTEDKAVELPIVKIFDFKGKSMFFIVKLTKLYDKSDEFSGIVAIFYDVTNFTMSRVNSNNKQTQFTIDKIPVMLKERIVFLDVNNIVFIKSIGSSTMIKSNENNEYFTNLKISELQKKLESKGFFRSHKSYLVNLSYLKELVFDEGSSQYKLRLSADGVSFFVPLSKRNRQKLSSLLSI